MWCDGDRDGRAAAGCADRGVAAATMPVRLARLTTSPFTDRLVAKFDLPVEGWRGAARRTAAGGLDGTTELGMGRTAAARTGRRHVEAS